MRPESASQRLDAITHAKSRMYEFNVPEELQDIQLGKSDPSVLFPLVIGILGDEAGRVGDIQLGGQTEQRRILPEDASALRFTAAFLHAYVNSKFANGSASELLLLSAAAYYLSDLAGTASVLLREVHQLPHSTSCFLQGHCMWAEHSAPRFASASLQYRRRHPRKGDH